MHVTALIPTYNASKSILRAIKSALPQVEEVIVFDDGSTDDTLQQVQSLNNAKVQVYGSDKNIGVWSARSQVLKLCRTPLAAWLDSDDEFLPGRIDTLRSVLLSGNYGWVYDNMELYDGTSLTKVGQTNYPLKLNQDDYIYFQFARNFIKGACQALVDVAAARKIDYNALTNCSDYDHMLRAILTSDKRVWIHHTTTYRYYITPGSISSYKERQLEATNWILRNMDLEALNSKLATSTLSRDEVMTINLYMMANTENWQAILNLLHSWMKNNPQANWFYDFMYGVAAYHCGDITEANMHWAKASSATEKPECLNNLAVSEARLGRPYEHLLSKALQAFPEYDDAQKNLATHPEKITRVPLRSSVGFPD